jgi:hypothetical protein
MVHVFRKVLSVSRAGFEDLAEYFGALDELADAGDELLAHPRSR